MADNKTQNISIPAELIEMLRDKKTDSISLSKTSAGKYSWDIKIYCEKLLDEETRDNVTDTIEKINKRMTALFTQ